MKQWLKCSRASVRSIVERRRSEGRVPDWWTREVASQLISYCFAVAFGRWSLAERATIAPIEPQFLMCFPQPVLAEPIDSSSSIELMVDDLGHPDDVVSRVINVGGDIGICVARHLIASP